MEGYAHKMDSRDVTHRPVRPRPVDQLPMVEFRSSTRAFLFQSGTGWLWLGAMAALFGIGAWQQFWWQTLAGIALVTLPLLAYIYLRNRTHLYWLDGGRLFMRRGIFLRGEEEIELYRIKDTKVNFSVIQQIFDNGNITITSSDLTGSPHQTGEQGGKAALTVTNVMDARNIREELRNRVEAIRERRGVRELDLN